VSQYSAFDSRDLSRAGLTVTAQRGAFMVTAEINGLMGVLQKVPASMGKCPLNTGSKKKRTAIFKIGASIPSIPACKECLEVMRQPQ